MLDRPPRILAFLATAWLLVVVVQNSDAGVGITGLFTMLYGGIAIGVAWIVRMLIFLVRRPRGLARHVSRLFLIPPGALLLALTVGFLDAPHGALFRIRFALSENALTREARTLLGSQERGRERRLGLFNVQRVTVHDSQVRFITTTCGVVDSCGVVYSPNREPARWQEDTFTHLTGPWWHVYEGF